MKRASRAKSKYDYLITDCLLMTIVTDPVVVPPKIGLQNLIAEPDTKIISCSFDIEKVNSLADIDRVIYTEPVLKLVSGSLGNSTWSFPAPNPEGFTKRDILGLIAKMEETERKKKQNFWFGGPDLHHVFLESVFRLQGQERWQVGWGS